MKIAYIAHPIGGDVKNNITKVLAVCKDINLSTDTVVPFIPYLADVMALDDDIPAQRERGIKNDLAILNRDVVDELWLYGERISNGMQEEINVAHRNGIKVVPKTPQTAAMYQPPALD